MKININDILEMIPDNLVDVNIVNGSEGYSLQVSDPKGNGIRSLGPKAWGNPYNKPSITFNQVNIKEFIKDIIISSYEREETK